MVILVKDWTSEEVDKASSVDKTSEEADRTSEEAIAGRGGGKRKGEVRGNGWEEGAVIPSSLARELFTG